MKNQKLKLDELKVQSFVTDFDKEQGQTQDVNGGFHYSIVYCGTRTIITITRGTIAGSCAGGCPTTTYLTRLTDFEISDFQERFQ